jgi:hypothetical protein
MNHPKYTATPTHGEIGARSLHLWKLAGRPSGRDLEFWLAAEVEVSRERQATRRAIEEDSKLTTPGRT